MLPTGPHPSDAAKAVELRSEGADHPRATLAASILGSSVAFIDGSVVNVALPAIGSDLGAGGGGLAWTVNAYLLPLGALVLLGGALGDHFGRRRLFVVGLVIFGAASIVCAVAPSLPWLLAGRALQGGGAALLVPNSLALLGAAYTGASRGQAIGTWAAVGALAGALGPLLGGWLVDTTGWRAIFLLNVPLIAGALWLAWSNVSESREGGPRRPLDWTGAILATAFLSLLTWALTAAGEGRGDSPIVGGAGALGAALLALFVWVEARRGDGALVPPALFGNSSFVGLTLFTFLLYGALGGLLVLLPFVLIEVAGYSAVAAGAAILPLPLLMGLGSPLMGRLTARIGGRAPLFLGAALVAIGLGLYAQLSAERLDYWPDVFPGMLLIALGMTVCVAPLTTTVMASVDADHVGTGSGFNNAVARIGGLIATALLGFVLTRSEDPSGLMDATRVAALLGAAFSAAAAACALTLVRPRAEP